MKKETYGAVVLAAGKGKRMHSAVQKQFLMLGGKPVIFYSLEQFEQCPFINEIVLVTGEEEIDYCRKEIVEKFDFIETFNSCENAERNIQARQLANIYNKPGFGGSDSHKTDCIGTAYTRLPENVTKESELIALVKAKAPITYGGSIYNKTTKDKIGKVNDVLIYSFWVYNKVLGLSQVLRRRGQSRYLNLSKANKEYFFKSGGPELKKDIKKAEV